ncbi:MAG TPA: hypothetical protein DEP25_02400 [Candidatus Taylorbacteria bacterium]|nr:hypothetical protein [Candidatus Taylorbacteria bacterium]
MSAMKYADTQRHRHLPDKHKHMFSYFSKRIAAFAAVALLSAAVIIPASRLLGEDSPSVAYLKSKPLSPWSIMALAAAGEHPILDSLQEISAEKAIDLEAPILALTAAGKDPRTFPKNNLILKLKSFYDGTQLGDSGIVNDDIFGLLALIASGEKMEDAIMLGIKEFILSTQNTDGGFSFAVGGGSDTNTTAAAIMALRAALLPADNGALVKAISYLNAAQNEDGGFPYDPKSAWGAASDASSDAWVVMALRSAGIEAASWQKASANPITHLEGLKQEAGFYLYQSGGQEDSFTPVTTSYAVLALSGKTLPVRVIVSETPSGAAFNVQVEGKRGLLCDADGVGKTALDALQTAANVCSLAYHVQSSALGDYVDEVAGEKASGNAGWLYTVNGVLPSVGASAYALMEGDVVRWYFGNLNGTPASESVRTEVPLSVVIAAPASPGGGSEDTSGDGNTLSMIVDVAGAGGKTDGAIDFGTASRGSIALQNIMLKNGGSIAATVSASVSGNAVFRRYLRLDEKPWREYQTTLPGSANSAAALSLPIPADYAESGAKSGSLIFWATPTAQ